MRGDRLGAHTRARYRWFRKFIDQHDDLLDESIFSALQSVVELQGEAERLEKAVGLMGLAQTGLFVELLVQFNGGLDSAFACGHMPLPESLADWKREFETEREARVYEYNAAWSDPAWVDRVLPSNEDQDGQFEMLTTIKAGFSWYSKQTDIKDTHLTDAEEELLTRVYAELVERWGLIVVTIPDWFMCGSQTTTKRWGMSVHPLQVINGCDNDIVSIATIWWDLHHPHIVRLIGVCHVSDPPLLVHESTRPLSEYIRQHSDKPVVWKRMLSLARGLHYLHQRGYVCRDIAPDDCFFAGLEGKAMLSGERVVMLKAKTKKTATTVASKETPHSVESNVVRFGLCVLAFLHQAAMTSGKGQGHTSRQQWARLPSSRPEFVSIAEWVLIERMCQPHPIDLMLVIQQMQTFASTPSAIDRIDDTVLYADEVDEFFLPLLDCSLEEALAKLDRATMELDERKKSIYKRCVELYHILAMDSPKRYIVAEFGELLWRIIKSLEPAQSFLTSDVEASPRQANTTLHFHVWIDRLLGLLNVKERSSHDWRAGYQTWLEREIAQLEPTNDDEDKHEATVLAEFEAKQLGVYGRAATLRSTALNSLVVKPVVLPRWFIPHYEVTTSELIAQGSFGSVSRGKWFDTDVVVKELFLQGQDIQRKRPEFLHEAETWFQLNHMNIVKMYGGCHVGRLMFVCESAPGGSLPDFLRAERRDPNVIWLCLFHAAMGLRYLHDVGVVHGDLKSNNIVVGKDGVAKLTDFGLSFFRRNAAAAEQGAIGAYRWKAPECLDGEIASFASDVFSFGMCIVEAVSGELPWGALDDNAVKYHVRHGKLPERPDQFGDDAWDLVESMCRFDPSERPSMATVMVRLAAIMDRRELRRLCLHQAVHELDKQPSRMHAHAGTLETLLVLVKSGLATRRNGAKLALQHFAALVLSQDGGISDCEAVELKALLKSHLQEVQIWAAVALGYCECPIQQTKINVVHTLTAHVNLADVRAHNREFLLREEAVRALGILASGDPGCRSAIAAPRTIRALIRLVQLGAVEGRATAARTLGCLAAGKEDDLVEFDDFALVKALSLLAQDVHYIPRREGAWSLRRLINDSEVRRRRIAGIARGLFEESDAHRQRIQHSVSTVLNEMLDRTPEHWGSIASLVEIAMKGTEQERSEAKLVLSTRARKADEFRCLGDSPGPIHLLIRLLRVGDEEEKTVAASELGRLARGIKSSPATIVSAGGIPPLIALACDGTLEQRREAVKTLRVLSLEDSKDVTSSVIEVMSHGERRRQQANAVEALGRLVFRNYANQIAAVTEKCVPALIAFTKTSNNAEKTLAVRALGRLADGNDKARAVVVCEGAIQPILELLRYGTDGQKAVAVRALEFLAIDDGDADVREETIPVLMGLARDSFNTFVKEDVLRAIDLFLVDASMAYRATLAEQGGIPLLVELALDRTDGVRGKAVQVLKRLADINDDMVLEIIAPIVAIVKGVVVGNARSTARDASWGMDQSTIESAHLQVLIALVRRGSEVLRRLGARMLCRLWSHTSGEENVKGAEADDVEADEPGVRRQNAVRALESLACCNPAVQAAIAQQDVVPALLALHENGSDTLKVLAARTLGALKHAWAVNDPATSPETLGNSLG